MKANHRWTPRLVAVHYEEAVSTLLKLPRFKVQGYYKSVPDVIHTLQEIRLMEPRAIIVPATQAAISRLDRALEWIWWPTVEERKLIWWRASGISCQKIGRKLKRDQSTIWRQWQCGLAKISSHLNRLGAMPRKELMMLAA